MRLITALVIVATVHAALLVSLYACGRDSAAPAPQAMPTIVPPTNTQAAGPPVEPTKKPKKDKSEQGE